MYTNDMDHMLSMSGPIVAFRWLSMETVVAVKQLESVSPSNAVLCELGINGCSGHLKLNCQDPILCGGQPGECAHLVPWICVLTALRGESSSQQLLRTRFPHCHCSNMIIAVE